jgi:hypothetical protein
LCMHWSTPNQRLSSANKILCYDQLIRKKDTDTCLMIYDFPQQFPDQLARIHHLETKLAEYSTFYRDQRQPEGEHGSLLRSSIKPRAVGGTYGTD